MFARWPDERYQAVATSRRGSVKRPVVSEHRFNYVAVRRADVASHSWTIPEATYRAGSVRIAPGLALDRTMV